MKKLLRIALAILVVLIITPILIGAKDGSSSGCTPATSRTGITPAPAPKIETGSDGLTNEQRNIGRRQKTENQPGDIKYFYAFSAYSNTYLFSVIDGKPSSSGKRLSPYTASDSGFVINMPGSIPNFSTQEVLQDDGTYGSSIEYLYWFDPAGNYYQYYPSGGFAVIISTRPIPIPDNAIVVRLEPTIKKK